MRKKNYYPYNILSPDRKDKNEKYEYSKKKKNNIIYLTYVNFIEINPDFRWFSFQLQSEGSETIQSMWCWSHCQYP